MHRSEKHGDGSGLKNTHRVIFCSYLCLSSHPGREPKRYLSLHHIYILAYEKVDIKGEVV
ncbi:MAG: hypothetical protein CW694_03210 [Candidatus Syntrophoarchaeum sp. WYZ-LMO15]|nr:MAG: hypothetical protein CW694_03210 [Candidatus Syntrophoarchaeum sp. WYZ-LMO15]